MKAYGWDWNCDGVTLYADGKQMASMQTRFPSRDGLRLVDLATECQPDQVQVSDHGAGRRSVQLITAGKVVADHNF